MVEVVVAVVMVVVVEVVVVAILVAVVVAAALGTIPANSATYRSEARRPWGWRTVVRWTSNPPCENKSATETPTNTLSQQVLDGKPATRADMPSMKVKGQTRKEAF
ncbi:hypothetical protein ElyMa_006402700 [Elysia marginata]|uniref:Secreted protein n=1 Tax=Elysia marginata TaxID=1093978 RepID=A0AAV4HUA6_9GAST|nr:hypothetical protein ElyMa_006402700 [Elysia marginata]